MTKETLIKLTNKFFTDPDWHLVEEVIRSYIEPLKDITGIDVKETADNVKAQVAGRIIAYQQMERFLKEAGILKERINTNKSFE